MSIPMNQSSEDSEKILSKSGTLEGAFDNNEMMQNMDQVDTQEMLAQQYQQQWMSGRYA